MCQSLCWRVRLALWHFQFANNFWQFHSTWLRSHSLWPVLICLVFSFLVNSLLLLTQDCFGATVGGRTSGVITPTANSQANKNSRPTVMHPAFQNAGKSAGLEVWRVEVSHLVDDYWFIHWTSKLGCCLGGNMFTLLSQSKDAIVFGFMANKTKHLKIPHYLLHARRKIAITSFDAEIKCRTMEPFQHLRL